MSVPIFTKPERRDPFAGARQAILGGINQQVEQDAINRLLSNINQQDGQDPLTAILGSGLPQQRQNDLINAFQNQEQIQARQANAVAGGSTDKLGEKFLEGELDSLEELGNLEIGLQNVEEAIGSGNISGRLNIKGKFFPTAADQQLKSGTKPFLGIGRKLFGANVAREQSKLLQDMFPAPGKSEAENRVGAQVMRELVDLKRILVDTVQNDPAVLQGQVNAGDVARIKQNQRELMTQFFDQLRLRKQAVAEAKKRGLL